jgi:hypothetical protein
MNGYCEVCGLATSKGLMGVIYYCDHKPIKQEDKDNG